MVYKIIVSKEEHKDTDDIVYNIVLELGKHGAAVDFLEDVDKRYCGWRDS